jgi:hypothetical protein
MPRKLLQVVANWQLIFENSGMRGTTALYSECIVLAGAGRFCWFQQMSSSMLMGEPIDGFVVRRSVF